MSKYTDLMIDLETLGKSPDGAILSIAAVPFNMSTGQYDKKNIFYKVIDVNTCIKHGLTISGDTFYWWLECTEEAKKELLNNKVSLLTGLNAFSAFIKKYSKICIWGNSNSFDLTILANAYNKLSLKIPWSYKVERDVRTLVSLKPDIKTSTEFIGVKHYPVDDCIYQINYCSQIWRDLNDKDSKKTEKPKTAPGKKNDSVVSHE